MAWMGDGRGCLRGRQEGAASASFFGKSELDSQLFLPSSEGASPHGPPRLQHEPCPLPSISGTAVAPRLVALSLSRSPEPAPGKKPRLLVFPE